MLEVTRKCNMHCAHCMRGEQQEETMSTDTVQKLLEHTYEIEQLSITGGEPSLAPDTIRWLAYFVKSRDIKIGSFFCATNAGEYSAHSLAAEIHDGARRGEDRRGRVFSVQPLSIAPSCWDS